MLKWCAYKTLFANPVTFIIYTYIYIYICIPVRGRFKGFDWGITTSLVVIPQWLEVIPQWLVVIPQQGKFKAPQSIIKKCVNTQVNICKEQLGTMDYFVVSYQKLRYKQVISHYTCGISLLFTLCFGFASASCNNNDIPLVV